MIDYTIVDQVPYDIASKTICLSGLKLLQNFPLGLFFLSKRLKINQDNNESRKTGKLHILLDIDLPLLLLFFNCEYFDVMPVTM